MIIGICGASGSGKTTKCTEIKNRLFTKNIVIISLDSFYSGVPDGVDPKTYNFDSPDAFNIDQCIDVIKNLKNGKSVSVPQYDFITHKPKEEKTYIEKVDIVLFEGIFGFYWQELRDLMDLRIYIETASDICLMRRTLRDVRERGRTLESIYQQYEKFVRPAYLKYIKDASEYAHIIIPNNTYSDVALHCICERLRNV